MRAQACSKWQKDEQGDLKVSFEFFPPKTEKMEARLWDSIRELEPLAPRFVSVTYGAGGSTREKTKETVTRILDETDLIGAAHFTCVDASKDDVLDTARDFWDAGIRHLVALRGDPPQGEDVFQPHPDGFSGSAPLVEALKKVGDFDITVAGYPEVHPNAKSPQDDIDYLKKKVDAGADRIATQYFFDNDTFLRWRDRVRAAGIEVPIVAGIMPIHNFDTIDRFSAMCGAIIPDWLRELFEGLDDDPDTRRLVAQTVCAEQCMQLMAEGVDEFHFYTLNRSELTKGVCRMMGICPGRGDASRKSIGPPANAA